MILIFKLIMTFLQFVGNKVKRWISKRRWQEKARQMFRKTNIFYPLIRTRMCAYQGVRNVCFSENLTCFVFLLPPFWDSPFCFITDEFLVTWAAFSNRHCSKVGWHCCRKKQVFVNILESTSIRQWNIEKSKNNEATHATNHRATHVNYEHEPMKPTQFSWIGGGRLLIEGAFWVRKF